MHIHHTTALPREHTGTVRGGLKKSVAQTALCLATVAMLAGCFGGGGDDAAPVVPAPPPPPTNVSGTDLPIVVTTSVTELTTFAKSQQTATSDSTDPLLLGDATLLASDDAAEPGDV